MDSTAITMAILTHPLQVVLAATVIVHLVRATFSRPTDEPTVQLARRPIKTVAQRQAA